MMATTTQYLNNFYQTPLGKGVASIINNVIGGLWSKADGQTIVGTGHAHPYLTQFLCATNQTLLAIPQKSNAQCWPTNDNNSAVVIDETLWPFQTDSIDKLVMVHHLEFSVLKSKLLQQAWRTLKPNGEIIIIVPNKNSIWSRSSRTPFGCGHAYTEYQMESILNNYGFEKITAIKTLMLPPYHHSIITKNILMFEKINNFCHNIFGGIIIFKAVKQVYGLYPPPAQHNWMPQILNPVNLSSKVTKDA